MVDSEAHFIVCAWLYTNKDGRRLSAAKPPRRDPVLRFSRAEVERRRLRNLSLKMLVSFG